MDPGLVRKSDVYMALAERTGVQYVDPATHFVDSTLLNLIPEESASLQSSIAMGKQALQLLQGGLDRLETADRMRQKLNSLQIVLVILSVPLFIVGRIVGAQVIAPPRGTLRRRDPLGMAHQAVQPMKEPLGSRRSSR